MSNTAKFEVPDSGDNGKAYIYSSGSDSHVLTDVATQAELDAHTHGTLPLSGSGEPNGVVTATVGRTYEDTSTGYQWSKITGTGNTGWQITNAIRNETLDAGNAAGENYSIGLDVELTNATNGTRGDSIVSNTALSSDDASFGFGTYINFTGAKALAGPGAMHGIGVYGEIADDTRYGEAALMGGVITNNRDGALAEGYEITIEDTTGGGRNVGVGIISKMQAAVTRWFRGIWLTSTGSATSGDAIYIDGAGGWTNYVVAKDTAGTTKFQVDASGNLTAGTAAASGFYRAADTVRFFAWYDGDPEGVVSASPGAMIFNTLGGASTTIYVKESGTGNTNWKPLQHVAAYQPLAQSVNAQTGTTYTLVAGDAGKLVTLSNASAITLTVPQDSDATIAVGTYVDLMQLGAGQVTVAAGTGATLRTSGLTAKARAQYARFGVQKIAADTWSLFGDLAAA